MSDNNVTGTTPFPISSAGSPVRVWLDVESICSQAQQPQTQQMANFEATANEDCINGSTIAVNQHFVVYTVKSGLIRVLHRHSTLRTLLRGHPDEFVTDMHFFQDGDVLATVGSKEQRSTIVIWRIYERQPEVLAEKLLEISSAKTKISRILWHPFNANQFWMVHTNASGCNIATLVETTKIRTHPVENHVVCDFFRDFVIMENAITVQSPTDASKAHLTDLAWSPRDIRHVLTTHSSGEIVLWDLKNTVPRGDGTWAPTKVQVVLHPEPVSRCIFLPHDDQVPGRTPSREKNNLLTSCFATASKQNSAITLWTPFRQYNGGAKPTPIQIIELERPSPSYILNVVYGLTPPNASPLSSFLVLADRHAGNILAFHLRAQWEEVEVDDCQKKTFLVGVDYVVPFKTRYPVYSWSVQCVPATDITEEELVDQGGLIFDTKLFAYQSKLVQCLTLTSYMCLPPEMTWVDPTPGVRVERLYKVDSAHISVVDENEAVDTNIQYDEDYDYDGENDDEEGEEEEEDGNLLEVTNASPDVNVTGNPFANWLGAIAAKSSETAKVAPPPPPPPPPALTLVSETKPPISNPIPPPSTSKNYAVPVVTAPPASDLPAPDGEPLAFLSPADFVAYGATPGRKVPDTMSDKKQPAESKKGTVKSKKSGKKVTNNDTNVTILKRDPVETVKTVAPTTIPDIAAEIRQAIKEEMRDTVIPIIKATVKESLSASVIKPLQTAIDEIAKQGVTVDHNKISTSLASSVDKPLRHAFADSMKNVFIPTLESVTGQILEKLSENLANSAVESNGNANKEIAAMSLQLSTMTELVAELTREVQALRDSHKRQLQTAQPVVPQPPPAVNSLELMKSEIRKLLSEKNFELAFTKAVSASTAELAVFCCAHADIAEVLAMPRIQLSQPIIICLMQQLGTVVATAKNSTLQVELEWLQDLALSLDPRNAQIQQHVPRVLHQLVVSINTRLAEGDVSLRRPLQRLLSIVRGIPVP